MTGFFRRRILAALVLAATAPFSSFAQSGSAADWPARPVTLVVPFPAGGLSDVIGRQLATLLQEELGQNVIVENRAGAATAIGASFVARAPKDGYTLLLSSGSTFTVLPHLKDKLAYKLADFDPVGTVCISPYVFVVRHGFPAKTLDEFIAYAKANPGKINNATTGQGSMVHLLGELVASSLGISVTQVHYKGTAPLKVDMIGGQVDATEDTMGSALPSVQDGKYRALAMMTAERQAVMPDIPTFKELGYPSVIGETLYAVFAPAGTPEPIIEKLNTVLRKVTTSPRFGEAMRGIGNEPKASTPAELREITMQQSQQLGDLIKRLNLKAD
ncbi:tripartite tricarboxylate transporter substrate binding protein [Bordetella petrii]|nr:tripartite tricarboxylate transporter substrate binding protein [Bordetella petrii]